jgi:hypothetical protein
MGIVATSEPRSPPTGEVANPVYHEFVRLSEAKQTETLSASPNSLVPTARRVYPIQNYTTRVLRTIQKPFLKMAAENARLGSLMV